MMQLHYRDSIRFNRILQIDSSYQYQSVEEKIKSAMILFHAGGIDHPYKSRGKQRSKQFFQEIADQGDNEFVDEARHMLDQFEE